MSWIFELYSAMTHSTETDMPQLNAHLNLDGTCAEAMRFHERTIGGRLTVMRNAVDRQWDSEGPGVRAAP